MTTATIEREVSPDSDIDLRLARFRASNQRAPESAIRSDDDRITPAVSPRWLRLASADIKHLSGILAQLVELHDGPERDDYGVLRPTEHAFQLSCSLLVDTAIAAAIQSSIVPRGCVSTDSDGGVRIEWVGTKCSIHLVIPADRNAKSYLYHEVGNEYGTSDSVTPEALVSWLIAFQKAGEQR